MEEFIGKMAKEKGIPFTSAEAEWERSKLDKTAHELYGIDNFSDMIADENVAATADDLEAMIEFLTEKGHPVFGLDPFDF